jgi:flavodoxin
MVENQKNLIVFYSHEGNIRAIAHHLQSIIGADIYDIELKNPYPEDNREFVKYVKKEIKEKRGHEIIEQPININYYDNVFIGSANWGTTITPAMKQFLQVNDLSNVTVFPYFSHGGTGIGHMKEDIIEFSNCSNIKEPLLVYQMNLTDVEVFEWLKK